LGIDRKQAANFSFLIVVPLLLGKMAKDILGGDLVMSQEKSNASSRWIYLFAGGGNLCLQTGAQGCIERETQLFWYLLHGDRIGCHSSETVDPEELKVKSCFLLKHTSTFLQFTIHKN
jgi:hypothetical protein